MPKIGDAYVEIGARTQKFQKRMGGIERRFKQVGAGLARFGKRFAVAFGVATAAGAALAVRGFANFEAEMRNVNVIGKQTEKQLAATTQEVLKLALEMGKPPVELARALYDINSASLTGAQGLEVLRAATIAGRAGVSDAATAARAITSVINAYGLSAKNAGDISDILFKTVEKGVITFPELASNIGTVIASASAAKIPFDEVAAAIATMTKGGISAAESVTSLNRSILSLIDPQKEMTAALKDSGFETGAALLQQKGLAGAMQFVQDRTGGAAAEIVKMGFNMRAFKAVASLTRKEGRAFAGDLSEIADKSNRAGSTQAALAEQSKALKMQLDRLRSVFSVLAIQIGKEMAPLVRKLANRVQTLGKRFLEFMQSVRFDAAIMQLKLFWNNFSTIFKLIFTLGKGVVSGVAESFVWLGKTIGTEMWNSAMWVQTVFRNMGKNVAAVFKAIWEKIKDPRQKFKPPDLTPLTKGFGALIKGPAAPVKTWNMLAQKIDEIMEKSMKRETEIIAKFTAAAKEKRERLSKDSITASDEETDAVVGNEKKKQKERAKSAGQFVSFAEIVKRQQARILEGFERETKKGQKTAEKLKETVTSTARPKVAAVPVPTPAVMEPAPPPIMRARRPAVLPVDPNAPPIMRAVRPAPILTPLKAEATRKAEAAARESARREKEMLAVQKAIAKNTEEFAVFA